MGRLLEVRDLRVNFKTYGGRVYAVRGVSFHVDEGECVAIVGESGCGKSVTSKAIMRLIPTPPGEISGGEILFKNMDLLRLNEKNMLEVRGSQISMIFQDPMTYLNPTMTIGRQIQESIELHTKLNKRQARNRVLEMLNLVGLPNPEKRIHQYPHEFSGGMRQRVMIAIAMACNPRLLIADEPTTALDVTIQAQILDLMKALQKKFHTSIMLITHDLGVVANMADRVLVYYAGKIVEAGSVNDIFYNTQHPYTWALLNSVPKLHLAKREKLVSIEGTPPDLFLPPEGCGFASRCSYAMKICKSVNPELMYLDETHQCACWLLHEKAKKIRQSFCSGGKNYGA